MTSGKRLATVHHARQAEWHVHDGVRYRGKLALTLLLTRFYTREKNWRIVESKWVHFAFPQPAARVQLCPNESKWCPIESLCLNLLGKVTLYQTELRSLPCRPNVRELSSTLASLVFHNLDKPPCAAFGLFSARDLW